MPKKLHDCVAKVKAKGHVDNPWAVCTASLQRSGQMAKKKKRKKKGY